MSRLTLADIARKGCVAVVSGRKCGVVDDLHLSLLLGDALAQLGLIESGEDWSAPQNTTQSQ